MATVTPPGKGGAGHGTAIAAKKSTSAPANAPAKTGEKSGKGRGNNPAKQ